ncbi:F-box-like protein [Ceratobasidium sp. AG-Ba]|nr:F-box-like protein [Ceratobasidium sp. AG-Ba]QRW01379.1 F-box-like protein [Ceratobasidium sp. AG-Ba]
MLPLDLDGLLSAEDLDTVTHSALQEWRDSRSLLASTIKSYLSASINLRNAYNRTCGGSAIEQVLVVVDSELESLAFEEQVLHSTRMSLATMRNKSARLVHINMLPPETLASIFAMSKTYCVRDDKHCFHNFTGVCAYWRQIALDRAELWSHIDIGPETHNNLATLLLERTKHSPIHVHLYEPNPKVNDDRPTPEPEVTTATQTLLPHMNRIATLDLESYSYSRYFISTMLNLWFEHGSPSVARSLLVYRPKADKLLSPNGQSRNGMLWSRSSNAMGILRSVTKLHLQNVRFDWDSSAWRGLIDLRLSVPCDFVSISVTQLAGIFSENPNVVTLKLRRLRITCPDDWEPPAPVELACLKVLNLFFIQPDSLRLLLPLIALPNTSTGLTVGLSVSNEIHDHLLKFFTRSQMHTLHLYSDGYLYASWSTLLKSLPCPDDLVLQSFNMRRATATHGECATSDDSEPTSSSHLPSVTLLLCVVGLDGLKNLVYQHKIKKLTLEQCQLIAEPDGPKQLEEVRTLLLEVYPELDCKILDADSGRQSFYRKVFDR